MKKNIVIVLTTLFLFNVMFSIAQSTSQDYNSQYLDSIEKKLKSNFCNNILIYPEVYKGKELKEDRKILLLLNDVFLKDYSLEKLSALIRKNKKSKKKIEERKNGLIKITHYLLKGNFITADLKVEAIDSFVYRKTLNLSTLTNGKCGESRFRLFDFGLFKKYFISDLLFKVNFRNNELESNNYDEKKLLKLSLNHPDYKFNLEDSSNNSYIKGILLNQYNDDSAHYYSYLKAPVDFIFLIKNHKFELLRTLLFSPNYLYAVNAMESLQYISSKNEIVLDEKLKKQIEVIKHNNSVIAIKKTEDLFMNVNGYNELKITDDLIIKKYKNSL